MEEIRYCERCGEEFTVKRSSSNQRFCSYKCSNEWKWENVRERQKYVIKSCPYCGREISIPSTDHRLREGQSVFFCDKGCYSKYCKKNKAYHKCMICGNDITEGRSKRFCSIDCRNTHKSYLAYKRIYNKTIDLSSFIQMLQQGNPFAYVGREKDYHKEYNTANRQRINKQRREREANNHILKYANRIKKNIQQAYRRGNEPQSATRLILGCSMQEFMNHIESKFKEGMSKSNYGLWELDHIIPISSATSEDDVIRLCHYSNYQPLWRNENKKKSNH